MMRKLWAAVASAVLAGTALAAVPVAATAATAAVTQRAGILAQSPEPAAVAAGSCDPVWFIGARGSGESAGENYGYTGMGAPVSYLAKTAAGDLRAKGLAMAYRAVDYPADSVDVLIPNKAVRALLALGELGEAAALYVTTSVNPYDASIDSGIKKAEADVAGVLAACPDAKIIMAGYSQGAAVVHDAENWLAKNKPAELAHIAGTLLLGDPDRVQDTRAKTFGTAPKDAEGLRVALLLVTPHEVPDPADTAEIANSDDIVADFAFSHVDTLSRAEHSASVHTSYTKNAANLKLLASAATWIAGKIPGIPAVTWKAVGAPLPVDTASSPDAALSGVSCATASRCVAVGHYAYGPGYVAGLILTRAGGTWTAAQAPFPAGSDVYEGETLGGVSCPTVKFCIAVGQGPNDGGLILTWSGGGWTAVEAPLPAGVAAVGSYLTGVSCPSASYCVATGAYYPDESDLIDGASSIMLLTLSGGTWTAVQAPLPGGAVSSAGSNLYGVSCPTASYCVAVGDDSTSTAGSFHGLLLTRSGGAWKAAQAPNPAGFSTYGAMLMAVSCPSSSFCVAGGGGLLLTLSGGTWRAMLAPVPASGAGVADNNTAIQGVSCASVSYCVAGGGYEATAVPTNRDAFLTLSDGAWKAAQAPLPANALINGSSVPALAGLACPAASSCVAAGTYTDKSGNVGGMLVTQTG